MRDGSIQTHQLVDAQVQWHSLLIMKEQGARLLRLIKVAQTLQATLEQATCLQSLPMCIHENILSDVARHLGGAEQLCKAYSSMQMEAQLEGFLQAACKVRFQLHIGYKALHLVLHLHKLPSVTLICCQQMTLSLQKQR